jgi:NAD(P)-dependent dehydrogenase (short-subunit alcohol dehydrogenase family)
MAEVKPLAGKVAIVTGAGAGIGRAIAIAYGAAGAKVVVASRRPETVSAVEKEIKTAGGEAVGITCDVGIRDQVFSMVDRAVKVYGTIHVLVNNAQSFGSERKPTHTPILCPVEDTDEEEWEYNFRTGATASLWAMKAVFPHMKSAGYGRVINFGSGSGQTGSEGRLSYNAAKEAVRALTRTAAREWGKYGITVNAISPLIETRSVESWKREYPEQYVHITQQMPVRRMGTPEQDLAPVAVFLAGEGSGYMTGMTFMVDGGSLMMP